MRRWALPTQIQCCTPRPELAPCPSRLVMGMMLLKLKPTGGAVVYVGGTRLLLLLLPLFFSVVAATLPVCMQYRTHRKLRNASQQLVCMSIAPPQHPASHTPLALVPHAVGPGKCANTVPLALAPLALVPGQLEALFDMCTRPLPDFPMILGGGVGGSGILFIGWVGSSGWCRSKVGTPAKEHNPAACSPRPRSRARAWACARVGVPATRNCDCGVLAVGAVGGGADTAWRKRRGEEQQRVDAECIWLSLCFACLLANS
eukprot:COSAG02_NODE_4763_length_5010_cov_7.005091_6_plen_259_part_00